MNSSDSIAVVAAVICRDDKYLVCQRPLEKRHGGLWEFPGGKCEPGENSEQAIARELTEELGLELIGVLYEMFAVADADSPYRISFIRVDVAGEPECREHTALAWDTMNALLDMQLAPSDRKFVQHCLASRKP